MSKISVNYADFIEVTYDPQDGDTGNNSDRYTFTINTHGGQQCLLNDVEVDKFSFTIVGNLELDGFFDAIAKIRKIA